MTYKNTRTNNKYNNNMNIYNTQQTNITQYIDSWCQIVLDLLNLTFAELFYGFPHIIAWIAWIVVWILPRTL